MLPSEMKLGQQVVTNKEIEVKEGLYLEKGTTGYISEIPLNSGFVVIVVDNDDEYIDGTYVVPSFDIDPPYTSYYNTLLGYVKEEKQWPPHSTSNMFLTYALLYLHNEYMSHVKVRGLAKFLSELMLILEKRRWKPLYSDDTIRDRIKEMNLSHEDELFSIFEKFLERK